MQVEELQLVMDELFTRGIISALNWIKVDNMENEIVDAINKQMELDKQAIDDVKNNSSIWDKRK